RYGAHRDLHSFPTRRSSDLLRRSRFETRCPSSSAEIRSPASVIIMMRQSMRSEEHTSELQSHSDLVCRLFNDTATTEIYTLSLHDALPIWAIRPRIESQPQGQNLGLASHETQCGSL